VSRKIIAASACWVILTFCAITARATDGDSIRRPLGVYAHVDVEFALKIYQELDTPPPPGETFRDYLDSVYESMLLNPAISGLAIGEHWDHIQTADGLDWGYLDDAFSMASAKGKTVKLLITPGVDTPSSILANIPRCDVSGQPFPASPDCASVKFLDFPEHLHADGKVFPMPWSTVYEGAWSSFLTELNGRYYVSYTKKNPVFVAIAIAGPVGASSEMILPTTYNDHHSQPSGLDVDHTWDAIVANSFPKVVNGYDYYNTDQVFIDYWQKTIADYEKIFSGITLMLTPDSGTDLPEFAYNKTPPSHPDNFLFQQECATSIGAAAAGNGGETDYRSCEAKSEILSRYLGLEGQRNARAAQVGGMTAHSVTPGDIGVPGVKLLTTPQSYMPYLPPLIGGAEFDYPVSTQGTTNREGCPLTPVTECGDLGVEDAEYHVLHAFFDGTPKSEYYGAVKGPAIMSYLDVPYLDVLYAERYPCQNEQPPSKIIPNISMQDLLNRARNDIYDMAGQVSPLPPLTCSPVIRN
jgi:hypothetical protein